MMWKFCIAFFAVIVTNTTVRTDSCVSSRDSGSAGRSGFREERAFFGAPKMRDSEDLFEVNGTEFILISDKQTHQQAVKRCTDIFNGHLAHIRTKALADFIAEAIGETNLVNSSVWISARTVDNNSGTFYWFKGDTQLQQISEEVKNLIDVRPINVTNTKHSCSNDQYLTEALDTPPVMNCMSIERIEMDVPRLHPASCSERKPILCERANGNDDHQAHQITGLGKPEGCSNQGYYVSAYRTKRDMESTHPGWIKVDDQYCKIYGPSVAWGKASEKCQVVNATLATLALFSNCKTLARFLKIGRPSIRQAWIGAKYESTIQRYRYENGKLLDSLPDEHDFPPWRNGVQQNKMGCLTLDWETSTDSVFLNMNCQRKREYICCKDNNKGKDKISTPEIDKDTNFKKDIIIDDIGYRVYYQKLSWRKAINKCKSFKRNYGGKLVEVREKSIISHLLEVMGGELNPIFHIWVGGKYSKNTGRWHWHSNYLNIPRSGLLNWLNNDSFYQEAEQKNLCLNMDRVINGIESEFYGTRCSWGQFFVCEFSREKLEQLQEKEARKK